MCYLMKNVIFHRLGRRLNTQAQEIADDIGVTDAASMLTSTIG